MNIQNIFDFYSAIKENNHREWFNANRKWYEQVKKETEALADKLIPAIQSFDPSIGPLTHKDCIFRINRDTRFSPDKTPYKTQTGTFFARGGKKSIHAGYYLHLEPGASFIGGGIYMPGPDVLKAIRQEIFYNYASFAAILDNSHFKKYYQGLSDFGRTARPPKGYDASFEGIEILKNKSFVVGHSVTDAAASSADFFEYITEAFKAMQPLCAYLNGPVDDLKPQ
jgi:uncharacterized protein (TIGR02453 family)